jgi:hypothetical protein
MFNTLFAAVLFLAQPATPIPDFQASVRVNYPFASSGTVFKVIPNDKGYTSYILSTGHMKKREEPEIEFFFMDGEKLEKSLKVKGNILFLVENSEKGVDFSLIEVTTKGKPSFVPIAKKDAKKGDKCLSVGCDNASKPKCYSCTILSLGKRDYILENDSPRAGRSGGGLFLNHEIVGVCWGAQIWGNKEVNGLFTRASVIRNLLINADYENLLE